MHSVPIGMTMHAGFHEYSPSLTFSADMKPLEIFAPFISPPQAKERVMERNKLTEFCTRKLAGILFENERASREPKATTDWLTAERFLSEHQEILKYVAERQATDCDYETFERAHGAYLFKVYQERLCSLVTIYSQGGYHRH